MSTISFVACDLDGTLLRSNHSYSDYTLRIWKELLKKQILFVPVTGRPFSALSNTLPLDICEYLICTNGVHIYQKNTNGGYNILLDVSFPWLQAQNIMEYKHTMFPDMPMQIYIGERLYAVNNGIFAEEYMRRTQINYFFIKQWSELAGQNISKIMLISDDSDALRTMKAYVDTLDGIHAMFSLPMYLEIFSTNASKGLAIEFLVKHLRMSMEHTLAIGDAQNDAPMLRVCKHKYIMNNATPDLLPDVPRTMFSNDEDGVARLLSALLL